MRIVLSSLWAVAFAIPSAAQSIPDGLCEIVPARGGYHLEIGRHFLPPSSAGVTVNVMAIDCATLLAGEAGQGGRPKALFMDVYSTSNGGLPSDLTAALDEYERRYANHDVLGRDDYGVYIAQRGTNLTGASAYSMIDGVAHIFSLVEFERQDSVDAAWHAVADYARLRAQ